MNITEKYLETLKTFDDWVIVSDWAIRVGEKYPDLLVKAESQAANQASPTTGLREIAARIGSRLSEGNFKEVEIDESETPRKVRYLSERDKKVRMEDELEADIEPLKRDERIAKDIVALSKYQKYRIEEIYSIAKLFNNYFEVNFAVDHAQALLNPTEPGAHHPDNLQLLIKAHNSKKHSKNWDRFSIDEQVEYIKHVVSLQTLVASRLGVKLVDDVLDSLLERLKKVYNGTV